MPMITFLPTRSHCPSHSHRKNTADGKLAKPLSLRIGIAKSKVFLSHKKRAGNGRPFRAWWVQISGKLTP